MTMPDERYRAIARTEKFLTELMVDMTLPENIREGARWCLRHYPTGWDLDELARAAPQVLQREFKRRTL